MTSSPARPDGVLEADFRIGKVVSTSFRVFRQHILAFSLIACIVWLPGAPFYAAEEQADPSLSEGFQLLAAFALILFLWPLVSAIVLHATIQHMRRGTVNIWEAIAGVFARLLPLLGLMFLSTLGALIGFALLIVPGLILMVLWFVATPACIAEKTGAIQSLRRSRELTRGFRWQIFALVLLTFIASGIGSAFVLALEAAQVGTLAQALVDIVWQGVSGGFSSVLVAVAYYHLRVAKEGVDVAKIAAVFD